MSTKFGVIIEGNDFELDEYGDIPEGIRDYVDFEEVAFRSNGIRWTNLIASKLPDETKVYPLDNTAQGIYTIGDIKKQIDSL